MFDLCIYYVYMYIYAYLYISIYIYIYVYRYIYRSGVRTAFDCVNVIVGIRFVLCVLLFLRWVVGGVNWQVAYIEY